MALRVERPAEHRIDLGDGDWITVKRRLTAGEERSIFARMVKTMNAGEKVEIDPMEVGLSQAAVYLLDWSAEGPDGKKLPIDPLTPNVAAASLNKLPADAFKRITDAVSEHVKAMEAERDTEKNVPAISTASAAI